MPANGNIIRKYRLRGVDHMHPEVTGRYNTIYRPKYKNVSSVVMQLPYQKYVRLYSYDRQCSLPVK